MNLGAILHEPKSRYAYAVNSDTVHLRIRTAKNEVTKVEVLAVDPFNWLPRNDGSQQYDFDVDSVRKICLVKEFESKYHDCWFAAIENIEWGRLKYCFIIQNDNEKYMIGSRQYVEYVDDSEVIYDLSNYFNYPYINIEDIYTAPEWVEKTVWYQIFPERFRNGTPDDGRNVLPWGSDDLDGADKKFGGNLQGIIEKLDYIKEIGFNGIYMTPVFQSPSSHKYDTTDYYQIDPEFGDNKTFKDLVEKAHERDIKIMLDAVFNHCGYSHPFWQDVVKNGKESKYYDCFFIEDDTPPIVCGEEKDGCPPAFCKDGLKFRTFGFTQTMPKWNTANPFVREYLMEVACYWIKEYNIDGWRLDVSNEVSHDFWREFRKRVKAIKKDVYILGENWDDSYAWLQGDQMDSVMNYEFSSAVWSYFKNNKYKGLKKDFRFAVGQLLTQYPKPLTKVMFNLLDSHDTARFLNLVKENHKLVKLAYLFLMTFPGSPSIFYGSEVGMSGGEHSNRQCMVWDKKKWNTELYEFIKSIIQLRKDHPSFTGTNFEWVCTDEKEDILSYKKNCESETTYVFWNRGEAGEVIEAPKELRGTAAYDFESQSEIRVPEKMELLPYGFKVLIVDSGCHKNGG